MARQQKLPRDRFLLRAVVCFASITAAAGCSTQRPAPDSSATRGCFLESGYLDSSNGCSIQDGYPDCYLVCPDKGTRKHL
jgi:hypothetical protein